MIDSVSFISKESALACAIQHSIYKVGSVYGLVSQTLCHCGYPCTRQSASIWIGFTAAYGDSLSLHAKESSLSLMEGFRLARQMVNGMNA
jgi:hypothetical protein